MKKRKKLPPEGRRPRRVESEALLWDMITTKGYKITKRGWPDFAVFNEKDKLIAVVEVKPKKSETKSFNQFRMLKALSEYGIPTFIWSPRENFKKIEPKAK